MSRNNTQTCRPTLSKALGAFLPGVLLACFSVNSTVHAQLVGLWRFDDNVQDASINANNGTLVGYGGFIPFVEDVPAQLAGGKSLTFEFQGEGVEVPDSTSLDITGDLTISAWIKSDNNLFFGSIANKGPADGVFTGSGTPGNYEFRREASSTIGGGANDDSQLTFLYNIQPTGTSLDFVRQPSGVVPVDEWSHVAVTVKQGTPDIVSFYVNGQIVYEEMKNSPTPLYPNDQPLRIATRGDGLPSRGLMDELSIWNVALSPENIAILATGSLIVPDSFSATGDYNDDGKVDAADYTVWRDNLGGDGTVLANRDSDNMGAVSSADYDSWLANFGAEFSVEVMTPGSGSSAPVPEPAATWMLVFGVAGWAAGRRWMRS